MVLGFADSSSFSAACANASRFQTQGSCGSSQEHARKPEILGRDAAFHHASLHRKRPSRNASLPSGNLQEVIREVAQDAADVEARPGVAILVHTPCPLFPSNRMDLLQYMLENSSTKS